MEVEERTRKLPGATGAVCVCVCVCVWGGGGGGGGYAVNIIQ